MTGGTNRALMLPDVEQSLEDLLEMWIVILAQWNCNEREGLPCEGLSELDTHA